jgi:hypothetical protein
MHAPPPYTITLRCFDRWKIGCSALVMMSLAVVSFWSWVAFSPYPVGCVAGALLWGLASFALLVHAQRLSPQRLRWDGQGWRWSSELHPVAEGMPGSLSVALDLGTWMLLRFILDDTRKTLWLPVQHRGHESTWYGLRATIYCARPHAPPLTASF